MQLLKKDKKDEKNKPNSSRHWMFHSSELGADETDLSKSDMGAIYR
jgi:hypothetical protein